MGWGLSRGKFGFWFILRVGAIARSSMCCWRICGNSHMAPSCQPVGFGTAIGTRPRTVRVLFTGRVGAMARFNLRCCRTCGNSRMAPSCQSVRFGAMCGHEVDPPPKHHKCSPCGAPEQAQTIHIHVFKKNAAYTASPRSALPTY